MEIDERLKKNLIADVENILEDKLSNETKESLKRCFEITIGHHYGSVSQELSFPSELSFEVITKMQNEFEPNPDTAFKQGMYSGYGFGLQAGYELPQSKASDLREELEKFVKWYTTTKNDVYIDVDEYLKSIKK